MSYIMCIFRPATPCDKVLVSKSDSFRNENNRNELNSGCAAPDPKPDGALRSDKANALLDQHALGVRLLQRPRENEPFTNNHSRNPKPPSSRFKELFANTAKPPRVKPTKDIAKSIIPVNRPEPSLANPRTATTADKTPHRAFDVQFKTPSIEYTSRRPNVLSRFPLNCAKSNSDLTSEFESKKIVFTTPSTVARPHLPPLADQSSDVSIDDSLSGVAPFTSPKQSTGLDLFSGGAASCATPLLSDGGILINGKRFVLEKTIGNGGSCLVYLATKCDTEEHVAVKVVTLKGDANIVDGYLNETKTLAKLQGDDSVVRLFELYVLRTAHRSEGFVKCSLISSFSAPTFLPNTSCTW